MASANYRVFIANMPAINAGVRVSGMPKYPNITQNYVRMFHDPNMRDHCPLWHLVQPLVEMGTQYSRHAHSSKSETQFAFRAGNSKTYPPPRVSAHNTFGVVFLNQ
jgi:hypothetical protein